MGAQGEVVGGGGEEFEEAIPIVGSSWDRPLVEPGRYRPGWFTPRGRSDMFLFGLAAAAGLQRPRRERLAGPHRRVHVRARQTSVSGSVLRDLVPQA